MVESQIKLSERALINNPNIKTKSELELKADLIKEIEEQIKSLDHTGNGFGILVSNITGFVSGYNFLLNDYKKLLEQAKTSQLTYKQLNDQYLALGNRLSGVAETSDTWALGSQVVKSTTETASVLAGKAIGGVAGGTAAGTLSSGLNSLASNATSASIGGDTFDPKKVGIETGQGFVKSAITAVSFKVGEVSGGASASALVKALPVNSISPRMLNLVGGTVGGFAGGGFGNGAGQINEMVMSKFGLGNKKEFDWDSFRLSLGFGGLGGAVGSQFGHSVPAVIADGLTGAGLGLGELAANNGGSLQGISREEFANTIAQNLVNPFIGKAVAHNNYSNPQSLIKNPEAVSELKEENTKELLKIANEHTLNNNPEKYIEFMTNFVKNATDEQLDSVSYNHFEEFFSKLKTNKLSEDTINKTFELLGLCSLKESNFVRKVFENLAWEQLIEYNPDKAFRILNTIANKHESQERVLIYQFTNHLDNYQFVGYSVKDKLSPEVKAEIVLTLSSRGFRFHRYDDRTIKYITKTLFEYGVLKQNENNKYFEALKEFIEENYSSNSYYRERKNYLQEIILKTPTEEIKNKEILDLFANDFIYSNDMNLHSKLVEIDPKRVLKELYNHNFGSYADEIKKNKQQTILQLAFKHSTEEYAQRIIQHKLFDSFSLNRRQVNNNEEDNFANLIKYCTPRNLWNSILNNISTINFETRSLVRDELISKLENNIDLLETDDYDFVVNRFLQTLSHELTEEEIIRINPLREKLSQKIIETENVDPQILLQLAFNYPPSQKLILDQHLDSFDNNTLKVFVNKLVSQRIVVDNFKENKLLLEKITSKLGKEEVLNILLENRENTQLKRETKIDNLVVDLGLITNKFLELIKLQLSKSLNAYSHDDWKQHLDNIFNILMSESKGIYLKDLFIDKYIDYSERDNTLEILENNIQSLDYLKPEYFDPEQLNSEQKQILFENLRHIYLSAKSKELISKLQPLTEKLFMEKYGNLFEQAKTDILFTIQKLQTDYYYGALKTLPELERVVKNNLEKISLENPIGFIKSFYEVEGRDVNSCTSALNPSSSLSTFLQKLIIDRSYEILSNKPNEEILTIFNHVSEKFILQNLEDNTELTPENISKINTIFQFQQTKSPFSISKTVKSLLASIKINDQEYRNLNNIKKLFNESPELIPIFVNELKKLEAEDYINNYKFVEKINNTQLTNLYKENLFSKSNLLIQLLVHSRDLDVNTRNNALEILKNASPEELGLSGNNIVNGLNNRNPEVFQAFNYFSQHLSDNGSLLCETFKIVYKQNIEKNLKPEIKALINELLSGNSNPVRQKKFDGLNYCFKNPQLELLLDFFLTEGNKYKGLGNFLELAHQLNFYNGILEINSEDPNFELEGQDRTETNKSSLRMFQEQLPLVWKVSLAGLISDDNLAIPFHKILEGIRIPKLTKKVNQIQTSFIEDYFNNIDFSLQKKNIKEYQEKLLSKLTEIVGTKKQEALQKVLNEFEVEKDILKNFPDQHIEGLIQASAYYKTAHSNTNEKTIFAELIKQTLPGNSREFILEKVKLWIDEVKQTNPDFNENNLRKPYSQTLGKYTIEIEPEAINYFNMSNGLSEHSCLNVTNGSNKDKVLNHALNAHTALIWIKNQNGNKVARQLLSFSEDGSLAGYPIYLFEGAGNKTEISEATQEFAKMYRGFLGL